LKLKYDELLSKFAVNFKLRRYSSAQFLRALRAAGLIDVKCTATAASIVFAR